MYFKVSCLYQVYTVWLYYLSAFSLLSEMFWHCHEDTRLVFFLLSSYTRDISGDIANLMTSRNYYLERVLILTQQYFECNVYELWQQILLRFVMHYYCAEILPLTQFLPYCTSYKSSCKTIYSTCVNKIMHYLHLHPSALNLHYAIFGHFSHMRQFWIALGLWIIFPPLLPCSTLSEHNQSMNSEIPKNKKCIINPYIGFSSHNKFDFFKRIKKINMAHALIQWPWTHHMPQTRNPKPNHFIKTTQIDSFNIYQQQQWVHLLINFHTNSPII